MSRDPVAEQGGVNIYGFIGNTVIGNYDRLGHQVQGSGNIPGHHDVPFGQTPTANFDLTKGWQDTVGLGPNGIVPNVTFPTPPRLFTNTTYENVDKPYEETISTTEIYAYCPSKKTTNGTTLNTSPANKRNIFCQASNSMSYLSDEGKCSGKCIYRITHMYEVTKQADIYDLASGCQPQLVETSRRKLTINTGGFEIKEFVMTKWPGKYCEWYGSENKATTSSAMDVASGKCMGSLEKKCKTLMIQKYNSEIRTLNESSSQTHGTYGNSVARGI